jgi:hypothetical protein
LVALQHPRDYGRHAERALALPCGRRLFRGDPSSTLNQGAGLLASTQRVIEEFSKVLSTISRSIENDGQITPDESDRIRQSWEELKSCGERFVVACERGAYAERSSSADGTQPAQSWSVGGG